MKSTENRHSTACAVPHWRAVVRTAAAWTAACLLAGCAGLPFGRPPPAPQAPPPAIEPTVTEAPESEPVPAGPTPAELALIRDLIEDGDRAIARDHLSYPARNSALDLYERVLLLDPGNREARHGIERIVERYLEMALGAAEQGRFPAARSALDRARLVDPKHPGIAPAEIQISLLDDADRRRFALDGDAVRDRRSDAVDVLRQAGLASRGDGCRAEIVARNDPEGRWMYQQMSESQGRDRIRAQLSIGGPPRVDVLCFPDLTPKP
ncbi:MAG: hypothetical protein RIB46_00445 [Pseudomonadales bacterium]